MVALPNVISADMTTAIREFGTEAARDIYTSPMKLVGWAVSALESFSNYEPNARDLAADSPLPTTHFVIVDKSLTRC